jgi:hypothetical protein
MKSKENFRITVSQLKKACDENKYIIVRDYDNNIWAINCKVSSIALKRKPYDYNQNTKFIGFYPCSFQNYITYKRGFL